MAKRRGTHRAHLKHNSTHFFDQSLDLTDTSNVSLHLHGTYGHDVSYVSLHTDLTDTSFVSLHTDLTGPSQIILHTDLTDTGYMTLHTDLMGTSQISLHTDWLEGAQVKSV